MIDGFLSSTYGKSRREREMDKLAQQLVNLPGGELAGMAQGGGQLTNQSPMQPGALAGPVPTTGSSMPPQPNRQGAGLGGQPPTGMEDGNKMAAVARLLKLADADNDYLADVVHTGGRGALIGAGLGGLGGYGFMHHGLNANIPRAELAANPELASRLRTAGALGGGLVGAGTLGVGAGLGAMAGQGAETDTSALLRGMAAGAVLPAAIGSVGGAHGAITRGALGAGVGGIGALYARSRRLKREEKEKQSSVDLIRQSMQKQAFQFANAAKALNVGGLLRHNAVPLATGAAGAVAGGYAGGRDGGGASGAIGGALMGGLAGAAAGKGGQLLHRADQIRGVANKGLAEGAKGMGMGAALKRSWNTEVTRNAQGLGFRGQAARPQSMMFGGANMPNVERVRAAQTAANPARTEAAVTQAASRRAQARVQGPSEAMQQQTLPGM